MTNLSSPREIIGHVLAESAVQDPTLVVLDADLGRSTRLTEFEQRFPDRYIQLGVAEQNAVGFASGLIYAGYHPVFVTFTMFAIGLPWTQLRQTAYAGLPIKIIGTHPGYDIGPDGGTHQMFEDLALARVIPELVILTPSDTPESEAAIRTALQLKKMVYIRIGRHAVPDLHPPMKDYPIGKAEVIYDGNRSGKWDCVLIADGSLTALALEASKTLEHQGLAAAVVNIRSLKPLDVPLLQHLSQQACLLVTIENHSVLGGLGGALAEIVAEKGGRLLRIGSPDTFGESASSEELFNQYGLSSQAITERILNFLSSL